MFTEERLWTLENFRTLRRCYVENTVSNAEGFNATLKLKLDPEPPAIKRLWAELAWVYYLFPTNMTARTKRDRIALYWRWSGATLPDDHHALAPPVLDGVGGAGVAYSTHIWREYRALVLVSVDWCALSRQETEVLLADPWDFATWLEDRQDIAGRMVRHALLYLLFPDYFEPIVTASHKRQIVRALHPEGDALYNADRVTLDRAVYDVRKILEKEQPSNTVNFYRPPTNERWQGRSKPPRPAPDATKPSVTREEAEDWFRKRFSEARVWWLGTGPRARLWHDSKNMGLAVLSENDLGDLGEYESRDTVAQDLAAVGRGSNPTMRSLALWQFRSDIQVGDVVIAHSGGSRILGWGRVEGDYAYDPERSEYPHTRQVEWHPCEPPAVAPKRYIAKALTDFSPYLPMVHRIFELIDGKSPPPPPNGREDYDIESALENLFIDRAQFTRILDSMRLRRNLILQGPPGTGKTFVARRIAWCLIGRKEPTQLEAVQFHQSYSYEDFVQGYRPTEAGGFSLKNGVFFEFCQRARESPEETFVFVIDEINRGNLSRIFGELLMLIEADKRSPEYAVALTYDSAGERFFVPANVYILGMMNTADRSLALVDYALRRRFAFEELRPAFGTDQFRDHLLDAGLDQSLVNMIDDRMEQLNSQIRDDAELGAGFRIGHSFFVPSDDDELSDDWYARVVRTQIQPLLQEYWFESPDRVDDAVSTLLAP